MSNKKTKNFFIAFSISFIIVLFFIITNNKNDIAEKTIQTSEQLPEVEILGEDIYGNQVITIDGEKSIFIE